jgi:hypothetical protein
MDAEQNEENHEPKRKHEADRSYAIARECRFDPAQQPLIIGCRGLRMI